MTFSDLFWKVEGNYGHACWVTYELCVVYVWLNSKSHVTCVCVMSSLHTAYV